MPFRIVAPLLFGLAGAAVLISLGVWQLQRLTWKQAILSEISERIVEEPISLSDALSPNFIDYASVTIHGQFTGEEVHVLASLKHTGAIYRIISVFDVDSGPRILVDRGFVLPADKLNDRAIGPATIDGNLHSPDEVDSFTPPADMTKNIWYARDVPKMASFLDTEELFVILRKSPEGDDTVTPIPVNTMGIPNDHLGYALTWFSLAIVWLGMTVAILWRIRQRTNLGQN